MAYGNKRDYSKRHIHNASGEYLATTTWAKTNKEAAEKYAEKHPEHNAKKLKIVKEHEHPYWKEK